MDRFYRGLTASVAGGVLMNVWSFFSYHILHFSNRRFVDWISIIVYGYLPENLEQILYALLLHLLWVGFLGIIFAYLIPGITSRGYLFKGLFYGVIVGIITYGIPTLFKTPYLAVVPFKTSISNHIGGAIWGLTMAYTLRLLDSTPKEKRQS